MRLIAFALAVIVSWSMLLLWSARVEWSSPMVPELQRAFPGNYFSAVFGVGQLEENRLQMTAAGNDYTSLQSTRPADVDAATLTTLRYRFANFPRTLELSLVFRTDEHPDDIAVSLPWPGDTAGTFDLSQIPEWHGRVTELAFAEFPTAQIVPPAEGFHPFALVEAGLWSRSWRGDIAALATDWLGAWPWTQRSVHALGRDTDTPRARSLVLCVALAALLASVAAMIVFGRGDRRFFVGTGVTIAMAWIALDVVWQAGLWHRLQTTRAVYEPLSWQARENTVADTEIANAAEQVRKMLRGEPEQTRVLVYTGAERGYELLRFIWHLLPRNVAAFAYALPFADALPDGCLIVFYESDEWRSNPAWRTLLSHSDHLANHASIHGDGFDGGAIDVFRFHHARR